jgi:hypothetical protein
MTARLFVSFSMDIVLVCPSRDTILLGKAIVKIDWLALQLSIKLI